MPPDDQTPDSSHAQRRATLASTVLALLAAALLFAPASGAVAPEQKKADENTPQPTPVVTLLSRIDEPPWQIADIREPSAVDLDAQGRRLVADRRANRVLVYAADGDLETSISFHTPVDADFLPNGNYLLTSMGKKIVVELDAQHKVVWEFGGLKAPHDADRLENGNTLITDTRPGRILEVDRAGEVVWTYQGDLAQPRDAEIDAHDQVLIADYDRHRIDCVRRDGSICWRFNNLGHPTQLELLADGGFAAATEKAGGIIITAPDRTVRGYWIFGPDLKDFALDAGETLLLAQVPRPNLAFPEQAHRKRAKQLLRIASGEAVYRPAPRRGTHRVPGIETEGKNLIVILFDSLRLDHVPWHGHWRRTAPNLNKLARRSLVFDQYITQASWTKPSVASLLTSTYPSTHRATHQKPFSHVPTSLVTMAEALTAGGYFSAAVMENPHMGDRGSTKGFEQGYERYEFLGSSKDASRMPAKLADTALQILANRPIDRPFFLTMFFMNPHYPYTPRRQVFGNKNNGPSNPGPINEYDAEILDADREVGRLIKELERLGILDDTIIVFTSDHGEEFGDHGHRYHGSTLYDCLLNVPLVIFGLDQVGRFPGLVRQVDLLPTFLDYLGVSPSPQLSEQMAGVSIRPFVEKGAVRTGLVAYSETNFRDDLRMISERSESRKIIADVNKRTLQIFDLENDPQEYNNLATKEVEIAELVRLVRWQKSLRKAERDAEPLEDLPEDVLERLRAAGYLQDE